MINWPSGPRRASALSIAYRLTVILESHVRGRAMNKRLHNRREFLGLTGAGAAGLASASLLGTPAIGETQSTDADPRHADLVVFNAKVYTVDSRMPKAEAFAVKGQRFVFVGNAAEAKTP